MCFPLLFLKTIISFFLLQFVVVFLICQHEAQKHNETELMKARSEQDLGKSSRLELMLSPPGGDDVTKWSLIVTAFYDFSSSETL